MQGEQTRESTGYWYSDDDATPRGVDVLNALRLYRASESALRRRTRSAMGMGETDLVAVQYLLQQQRAGKTVSPKELAAHLNISSASTTILIDRLAKSGHVERVPHPTDRRALIIVPTVESDSEVRATLGTMHTRLIEVADALSPDDAHTVMRFLESMREAIDSVE